jgi:hypothetical protein
MPASESRDESKPDFVENAGVFVSEAYDRIAQLLSKLLLRIFTPSRWLLQKLEKSENELRERLQSGSRLTWLSWWIAVQLVRLVSLVVYWASVGPIYIVVLIACAFLFWAALKPFFFSEWVGALWFGAVLLWLLSRKGNRFWKSFSNIAGAVAIGVTPQFLFLCAYNGFIDGEMTPPHVLQEAIKAYEHAAVWMYQALEPVREIAWFWWVLGALGLLFLTYVSESPKLFAATLWLRGLLASLVFVVAVATSFSLSSSIRVWNWEPDMNHRLQAAFKETVTHETELNLAEALKDWFASHKQTQTVLPAYVRSFEKALRELGQQRDDKSRQDLWKGATTAMKALVPKDLGAQLGEARDPNHGAERKNAADISRLLALEAQIKAENEMLATRANQARAATVNVIAQIVDVSATSIPLLKEIAGEMINTAAEILSERMLESLPIEKAVVKAQEVASEVKDGISRNIDALALGLFTEQATARKALNGMAVEEVKGRISEETRRIAVAREEVERARETARRARIR